MKSILALFAWGLFTLASWMLAPAPTLADDYVSAAPADATAYIISPQAGETVSAPFTVQFGLSGMGIAPAGVEKANTGHHHLLIDMASLPDLRSPLAASDQLKHFGGGQTEATLTLSPGQHTLQLVLANYVHIPHDPPVVSDPVTITVE